MILQTIIFASLILGCFFNFIAALGILRLPDLYTRMHSATKAGTVGIAFIQLAVSLSFQQTSITSRCVSTLLFVILTAPVAVHILGKVMLDKGYKIWRR